MQPIERYGLVSMLLLVVVIVAIVAWDGPKSEDTPGRGSAALQADAKGAAGRAGNLDLAPVQRNEPTRPERKPAPAVTPRSEDVARVDPRRDVPIADVPAPAPIVTNDTPQGGAGAGQPLAPFTGTPQGLAGIQPNLPGASDMNPGASAVNTPPVVSLAPSPVDPPAPARRPAGLPTGPFVVRAALSVQLAEEYGKEFSLWGPDGLVAAFEQANPGLDTARMSLNAQLVRPPLARVEVARKTPAVVPSSDLAAAPRREAPAAQAPAALPPGARPLDAVNVTPTVAVAGRTHTVQPGETGGQIAQLYYGRASAYTAIQAANPTIDINRIRAGQVLVIPVSADAPVASTTGGASAPVVAANTNKAPNAPRIK